MLTPRPNIVLVTLHDLGRNLRCYDRGLPPAPHVERMAREGVVFENHFSTCPLCSPARASIQTGRYPHSNGMNGLSHRGFALNADEKCLPQYLGEAGYHTALYGLQHEIHGYPSRLGYEEIRTRPAFPADFAGIMPHVAEFLRHRRDKPFFFSVGVTEVHRPFHPDPETVQTLPAIEVPPFLLDCPEVRRELQEFHAVVKRADRGLGQMLDTVDACGLSESTLLLFTTDHGFAFPRAKSTLYDPGIGVTLLARWTGHLPAGQRIRGMTSHVDMLPTLLEIAGAAGSERIQGRSFLRLLTDPCARGRERVFAEKSWHDNEYDPMRCIRTERYKFIRNFTEGFLYQIPLDIRRGEAGRAMEPLRRQVRALTELYDLQADPNETINLSGDPRFSEVEAELRTRLAEWMASTGDSLPARHIPWPQPGKEHFLNNMSAEVEGGIS